MVIDEGGKSGDKSKTAKSTKANTNSRFYVRIGNSAGASNATTAVFSEVSGLQMETELFEYAEGGNNEYLHRLPGITKVGNVTLKRGITKENELLLWYSKVVRGVMDLRMVTISVYATQQAGNSSVKPLITWQLLNAFPCKWSGPQLAANGDTVAIETIELAHMGVLAFE
ncbi:phage tail protein (plasmid) [Deinococcus psychrotolerans]|uniref:Phage tail protein n=1 Tax=Deinococcus psychrotolerans TaxID=2489213 RepID=A0A3G8YGT1_9DEIO|nr:phage tail protein [Deinococcus psychrotolerans]AZI44502.1 phage tail protein [Deinococcus psychrotolerans]